MKSDNAFCLCVRDDILATFFKNPNHINDEVILTKPASMRYEKFMGITKVCGHNILIIYFI
jgi:hypothetical protein